MKKILLDSSVVFTAVNSPSGGSAKLFTITKIKLYTTPFILTEVERNVRKKLTSFHLKRFFLLAKNLELISDNPDPKIVRQAKKIIAEKDATILADAKRSQIDILVSLDQKDFLKVHVEKFLAPKKVMTPKSLIAILEN